MLLLKSRQPLPRPPLLKPKNLRRRLKRKHQRNKLPKRQQLRKRKPLLLLFPKLLSLPPRKSRRTQRKRLVPVTNVPLQKPKKARMTHLRVTMMTRKKKHQQRKKLLPRRMKRRQRKLRLKRKSSRPRKRLKLKRQRPRRRRRRKMRRRKKLRRKLMMLKRKLLLPNLRLSQRRHLLRMTTHLILAPMMTNLAQMRLVQMTRKRTFNSRMTLFSKSMDQRRIATIHTGWTALVDITLTSEMSPTDLRLRLMTN
jgi:hypothetical protein